MTLPLFDETFLRKLEQLSLVARRVRRGQFRGEKRSARHGQSVEFADYRNYTRGDDLRALDWNIFARLERPFIKLFEEEIEQTVHVLIDASASMDFPQNDDRRHKANYARRVAAALGYIALANHDRLQVTFFHKDTLTRWGPERHRQAAHRLLDFLQNTAFAGETHLATVFRRYAQQIKRPGLMFIISDFLSAEDYRPGFNALQQRGHEIVVLHLLSPGEIAPALAGDFQLIDAETGTQRDVTVNSTLRQMYRQKFEAWQRELQQFCQSRQMNYTLISTAMPLETLILHHLRQRRLLA